MDSFFCAVELTDITQYVYRFNLCNELETVFSSPPMQQHTETLNITLSTKSTDLQILRH
jgi:hypothetical protein